MKTNPIALAILVATFGSMSISSIANASPSQDKMEKSNMGKMAQDKMMMMDSAKTSNFKGIEVNGGTAGLYKKDGKFHLHFSDDFKTPGSPSPHWQIIDGSGNTFLLQRITIAGDKTNRDIVLPSYITSVKKVQVWCSFAEVVLGEADFSKSVKTR